MQIQEQPAMDRELTLLGTLGLLTGLALSSSGLRHLECVL